MENLVLNIQKYSIHDGEGIRTTIFFKGCPMNCKWCHNPESQSYKLEIMHNQEKCTKCGKCAISCSQHAINFENKKLVTNNRCIACGDCIDVCVNNAREKVGKLYKIDELMNEIEKDRMFYEESNGGVTLSGGEVMTQNMDYIEAVLIKCKKMGYSVNIDTCGHASFDNFERILPYIDTFLYDIKHLDNETHKMLTGQGNELVIGNLKKLSENGAKINIRMPLVEGINSDDTHIKKIIEFLKGIRIWQINLLPYHNTGKSKYEKLGVEYKGDSYIPPDMERIEEIKSMFEKNNFLVKIGG